MDDPKKGEKPEDDLELDEESVSDIDVPDEDSEDVKGGMMDDARPTRRGCQTFRRYCQA